MNNSSDPFLSVAFALAARESNSIALTRTGKPLSSVPSTKVSVCFTSRSRESAAMG
jgi:hypothetical protein